MAIEIIDCILLKALKEFDITKKNKFNTLFWTYIKTAIKRELQSKNCKKRIGDFKKVSLNKMISSKKSGSDTYELEKRIKSNTFDRDYLDAESNQIIDKFSKFFNEKEKFIIKNIIKGKNTSDISKMLDITPAHYDMILSFMEEDVWYKASELVDVLGVRETRTKALLRALVEEGV